MPAEPGKEPFCIRLCGDVLHRNLAGSPVYPSLDLEATALVTGRVVAVSNKETYCTYRLEEVAINGEAVAGGVFLTSYTTTYIQDDRIAAQAKLSVPEKALYTGDFDDWRYCRSQNVLFRANTGKDALLSHAQDPLAWIHAAGRWMSGRQSGQSVCAGRRGRHHTAAARAAEPRRDYAYLEHLRFAHCHFGGDPAPHIFQAQD